MRHILMTVILAAGIVTGCVGVTGNRVIVDGAGPDDLLKLRAGPGLGFSIIMGLPDGTPLIRRGCVIEMGQSWCQVALADAPAVTGYVAEDYLAAR